MKCAIRVAFIGTLLCLGFFRLGWSVDLQGKIKEYKVPKYFIDRQPYISLKSVLKILECDNSWGRIEDRVFFTYRGKMVKLRVNSSQVVVDDKSREMDAPAREVEGEVLVHVTSLEKVLTEVDKESPVPAPAAKKPSVRSAEEPAVADSAGTSRYLILIDAGHGGHDMGAVGQFGLHEKDVNLDVSLRLRDALKKRLARCPNVQVAMTRSDDIFLSLEERVAMAKNMKADMFFCVHTNSSRYNRSGADGFETYFPRKKEEMIVLPPPRNIEGVEDETGEDSVVLQIVQELNQTTTIDDSRMLAEYVQEKLAERLICADRGAKTANFFVLKYTPMLSVLTEIGFICNPNIEANLRDVEVRQAIGECLAGAIIDFLRKKNVISAP